LEKSTGSGRLFVAKNRAGRDGILFPIHLDTAKSILMIADNANDISLNDAVDFDNNSMKKLLLEKWKQVNSSV